jgi:hypothetical protein
MKKSDLIPLESKTTTVDADGERIAVADTRSVESEIARLQAMGCLEAAQRLENSCEDGKDDGSGYVEVDPTNVVLQTVGKHSVPVAFVFTKSLVSEVESESKP